LTEITDTIQKRIHSSSKPKQELRNSLAWSPILPLTKASEYSNQIYHSIQSFPHWQQPVRLIQSQSQPPQHTAEIVNSETRADQDERAALTEHRSG